MSLQRCRNRGAISPWDLLSRCLRWVLWSGPTHQPDGFLLMPPVTTTCCCQGTSPGRSRGSPSPSCQQLLCPARCPASLSSERRGSSMLQPLHTDPALGACLLGWPGAMEVPSVAPTGIFRAHCCFDISGKPAAPQCWLCWGLVASDASPGIFFTRQPTHGILPLGFDAERE